MHFFRGSLHSCFWELFLPEFQFCPFADGVEPFCLTLRSSQFLSILSWLCRAVALALGDPDSSHSSDLFLALVWLLITCLSFLVVSFLFLFFWIGYLCVLSTHSSRGRMRTGASEDQWMVAPSCDEWLTTWCGLILGWVLQVQVAAWFVLVQVKSERERSVPCGASEEWKDKCAWLEGPGG
jgi:hypothetical protein